MVTRDEVTREVLRYYMDTFRQAGIQVAQAHGNELTNSWVVPYLIHSLEALDPSSVMENARGIDLNAYRNMDLAAPARQRIEGIIQEQSKKEPLVLKITSQAPMEYIELIAYAVMDLRDCLYNRIDAEVDALISANTAWRYESASDLVHGSMNEKPTMEQIKPSYNHAQWTTQFSQYLNDLVQNTYEVVKWASEIIPNLGMFGLDINKMTRNMNAYISIQEEISPDWAQLPEDVNTAGRYILETYARIDNQLNTRRNN